MGIWDRIRRRTSLERRRLEAIFDRKTANSLTVILSASKLVETGVIPITAHVVFGSPLRVHWGVVGAYALAFVFSTLLAVYWTQISEHAQDVLTGFPGQFELTDEDGEDGRGSEDE